MKRFWDSWRGYNIGIKTMAIVVVVNVLVNLMPVGKLDLTKGKVHTLTAATRRMIRELDDIVTVRVYQSQELPSEVRPITLDLKTILDEFGQINKKRLKIVYLDPSKDDSAKTEAERLGIQPLQFSSIKSDKLEVSSGYLGLSISYGNKQEVLPVAGDVDNLEYLLVAAVKRLTQKDKAKVMLANGALDLSLFEKYLKTNYEVVNVNLDDDKTELEGKVLIIAGDVKISDKIKDKIGGWQEKGNGLVVFWDKVKVDNNMLATTIENKQLEEILAWANMEVEKNLIVDPSSVLASFRTNNGSFLVQYPYWLQVRPENINYQIPAMSGISSLMIPWASSIKIDQRAISLFKSSSKSQQQSNFGNLSPTNKTQIEGEVGSQTLGAINTETKYKTALVADVNLIEDQFVGSNQQNLVLALNLVDHLSLDDSLLTIRSKQLQTYPIRLVDDRVKQVIKIANLISPVVILGVIFVVTQTRRKRQWPNQVN
jgi:ABC-type uncharacterized transport system involved in gliding motility auxiliary subunit